MFPFRLSCLAEMDCNNPRLHGRRADRGADYRSRRQRRTALVAVGRRAISAGGIGKARGNHDIGGVYRVQPKARSGIALSHAANGDNRRVGGAHGT